MGPILLAGLVTFVWFRVPSGCCRWRPRSRQAFFPVDLTGLVCSASQSLGVGAQRGRVMLTVLFCELLVGALFPHGLSYGVPGLSG